MPRLLQNLLGLVTSALDLPRAPRLLSCERLNSQGERFSTDRSRPRLKASSLSLSLSRARAGDHTNPTPRPGCPAPCRSIESCARSAPLLLSFLVAFQARRGPTTRSLLGSRTKDLLSFFTTRCVEELASKNNEFTFENKKSSHLKLFHASSSISF